MSQKYCCVPGCVESGDSHPVLHMFPNPIKYPDRFRSWVLAIGGDIIGLKDSYIFANRRVCHRHFQSEHCCRFNKLSQLAVPKIYLPGLNIIPHFTVSAQRHHLRPIENKPSTSRGAVELFGPEFDMPHHLFQECLPSVPESTEEKENSVPVMEVHGNIEVSDIQTSIQKLHQVETNYIIVPTMDIQENIEISGIQTSTQNPSSAFDQKIERMHITDTVKDTDSVKKLHSGHKLLKKSFTAVDSCVKSVKASAYPVKRLKRVRVSKQEKILYRKLRNMQIKLSRFRNRCKQYAASVKMSNNLMTNQSFINTLENMTSAGKILTLLQFRELQKKNQGTQIHP